MALRKQDFVEGARKLNNGVRTAKKIQKTKMENRIPFTSDGKLSYELQRKEASRTNAKKKLGNAQGSKLKGMGMSITPLRKKIK